MTEFHRDNKNDVSVDVIQNVVFAAAKVVIM